MSKIITISREFGSGGRSIGKAVAERLNIPFYDREIINKVSLKTGYDSSYIEKMAADSPDRSLFNFSHGMTDMTDYGGMTPVDVLWVMQCQVILEIAEEGPCVIVGRHADYVLRDRSDCFHIYIHADPAYRAERIVRLYGEREKLPLKRLKEKDSLRARDYNHYTERTWGDSHNYHLCLDSGYLGQDTCVDLICSLAK